MSGTIDTAAVKKLADLSRLEFNEDALQEIGGELGNILQFISKLQEVDTDGVQPTTSVLGLAEGRAICTPERADEVTEMVASENGQSPEEQRAAFQACAPEADMGFYVVPQVIE